MNFSLEINKVLKRKRSSCFLLTKKKTPKIISEEFDPLFRETYMYLENHDLQVIVEGFGARNSVKEPKK